MGRLRFSVLAVALGAAVGVLALTGTRALQAGETCNMHHPDHPEHPTVAVGMDGYSPVSYFSAAGPGYGSPAFRAKVDDVTYFFANQSELDRFNADPEKFLPAYGGWCATGMSLHKYFPVDPTNYKIVDGKLMLFLRNDKIDALKKWNHGDEAALIAKADAFWDSQFGESEGEDHDGDDHDHGMDNDMHMHGEHGGAHHDM